MHRAVTPNEVRNALKHRDHFTIIAGGTPAERRVILDNADDKLVRALKTMTRLAQSGGAIPADLARMHQAKIRKLVAPCTALRTCKKVVQGQRGGSFFKSLVRAALPILGGIAGGVVGPITGTAGAAVGKALASRV